MANWKASDMAPATPAPLAARGAKETGKQAPKEKELPPAEVRAAFAQSPTRYGRYCGRDASFYEVRKYAGLDEGQARQLDELFFSFTTTR